MAAASHCKEPREAGRHALALWQEVDKALAELASANERLKDIPLPRKFPATLKDFLRLVVQAKTTTDGTKRLRDFYRSEQRQRYGKRELLDTFTTEEVNQLAAGTPVLWRRDTKEIEDWAANQIKGWKEGGFRTESLWTNEARRYRLWWKDQLTTRRREAGSGA